MASFVLSLYYRPLDVAARLINNRYPIRVPVIY